MSDKEVDRVHPGSVAKRVGSFRRFTSFCKKYEFFLAFGFVFTSLHIIWFNLQRHVPMEERSEVKAWRAFQKWYYAEKLRVTPTADTVVTKKP